MIDFKVIPDDGGDPYEVTANARDVLAWERAAKGRVFSHFANGMSMVDMYELAWRASRRQRLFTGDQHAFEEAHEIEIVGADKKDDEGGGADPTNPGP